MNTRKKCITICVDVKRCVGGGGGGGGGGSMDSQTAE